MQIMALQSRCVLTGNKPVQRVGLDYIRDSLSQKVIWIDYVQRSGELDSQLVGEFIVMFVGSHGKLAGCCRRR